MSDATAILWFRRDLRLHDHPALAAALELGGDAGRLLPSYVLDPALLRGRWSSPNRNHFLLGCLGALAADLAALGSGLALAVGDPRAAIPGLASAVGAGSVVVTRDHGPYGRRRDRAVAEALDADGRVFHRRRGGLVHEPEAIATAAGEPYRVYTPFRRAWEALDRPAPLDSPCALPTLPELPTSSSAWRLARSAADVHVIAADLGLDPPTADPDAIVEPGERAARARLERWLDEGIGAYHRTRNDLGPEDGTSRLSQDLRFGLLSPLEVVERAASRPGPADGRRAWVGELAWREFYAHVLWHWPDVLRLPFRRELEAVAWRDDPADLAAWAEGRTGYPVVDAAMRQLRATGFVHNRARMIVAGFLSKDLLLDWRLGEAEFMRHLVDGDPASNDGGWQWTASTGTDPQPWFRIFNPVTQGRRFDPDGAYVRRWVPELAALPADWIHRPWEAPPEVLASAGVELGRTYQEPIVDHAEARRRALDAYGVARRQLRSPGSAPLGSRISRSRT